MKYSKVLFASTALVFSGAALAATDGDLGESSTGTAVVTVIKENAVQITDVDDIDLGSHPTLAADAVGSDDVCVFNSTGSYQVTVTSANGFTLSSGTDAIDYGVTWAANGGAAADASGAALTNLVGDNSSTTCGGGTNATFEVTVAAADFNAASPGTYTDTLTLLVEPE